MASAAIDSFYTSSFTHLPLQTIPLKDKLAKTYNGTDKSWGMQCMDGLETIGRQQYSANIPLIENYEMIRGRFIFEHYFHTEGYSSVLTNLAAEFEMPNYLRHYDIIGQVVNEMSGEWTKRPDLFKVIQMGDSATNEYLRTQKDLLSKYIDTTIAAEINKKLIEANMDPNKSNFASPEEQQQYQQQIDQAKQQLTPPEIQKYMDTDFLTIAEIWGSHQLSYDKEKFNLPELEKIEFEDMLVADRCFRHFYMTPAGHSQETWNPINVFFHKSPDVIHIEDGDYVGRIFNLTLGSIIDRYGSLMDKADFDLLLQNKTESDNQWSDSKYNWVYDQYLVPFKGYNTYDIMKPHWNQYSDGKIPEVDESFFKNNGNNNISREGFYFATEGYWKSQRILIKLTYIDPATNQLAIDIVDETAIIPDDFVESKEVFAGEHDINTYVKTTVNEVWKGVKLSTSSNNKIKKDIYLGIGPNDFQFKGDINIYGCKLPVCGQIFSSRNSKSASLVDMMKPHQIGYNVAMNQLYQLAEREVGVFAVMDVNMFPDTKDWGGEDAWGKWMLMAKSLGMVPADTSPSNVKASLAATGGYLPKVMDLSLASQMISRMNMAKFYEEQALKQVGFNQYRLGSFSQDATATGVTQGTQASYSQTESYFTNFSNYLRRCKTMNLNIAQYVQSKKEIVQVSYIKSDLSRAFTKVAGIDLLLPDLGIMVTNSQELARQTDMMRQFVLTNNTSGITPPDVADVIMMNSPAEIKRQLKVSYDNLMQQEQQKAQAAQKVHDDEMQVEVEKIKQASLDKQLDRQTQLDVARIKAGTDIAISNNANTGIEQPSIDNENKNALDLTNLELKKRKLDIDERKLNAMMSQNEQKNATENARIAANLQIQSEETQTARILKGPKTK